MLLNTYMQSARIIFYISNETILKTMAHWEHFEHDADIGVRGLGDSIAEAFEQAALAMSALIVTDLNLIKPDQMIEIQCQESDLELLLVDWLNAVIYQMAIQKMLFSRFQVCVEQGQLNAKAWGELISQERHQPAVEIKGATYTELKVSQQQNIWCAQCVVDV